MKYLLIALTLVIGTCKGSPAPQYTADLPGCNCPPSWRDYPVCGSNGVTYRSVCLLACARLLSPGLDVAYVGECQNMLLGVRDEGHCGYCPSGSPICGSDGVTYGSMCDLQCRVALAKAPVLDPVCPGPCSQQEVLHHLH